MNVPGVLPKNFNRRDREFVDPQLPTVAKQPASVVRLHHLAEDILKNATVLIVGDLEGCIDAGQRGKDF